MESLMDRQVNERDTVHQTIPAALERQGRFHARAKTVVNVEGVI